MEKLRECRCSELVYKNISQVTVQQWQTRFKSRIVMFLSYAESLPDAQAPIPDVLLIDFD